jgi:hypothetical protein
VNGVTSLGGPSEKVSAQPLYSNGPKVSGGSAGNGTEQQRGIVSISESVFLHTELTLPEANCPQQGSHLSNEVPQGSLGAL